MGGNRTVLKLSTDLMVLDLRILPFSKIIFGLFYFSPLYTSLASALASNALDICGNHPLTNVCNPYRLIIKFKRPLHNRKNFAVVTEKIFQVTLVARHFNRKWSFFLFLGEFSPLCNIWTVDAGRKLTRKA
ncbi:hypothetical protein SAMN05216406_1302 [Nitrosomonas ureae]|uniref:Uncharacterized protein n=1 Tax=Nitrosomonas ureae TaxID=44577 RepID=A0A1H2GBI7_9PROT|nr:hypothetical protein SAMN05216406_1302 [Nitrosomonas ureae]